MARQNFQGSRKARAQKYARAQTYAERSTANPETTSKKLRAHNQKAENRFQLRCGEAHSALRGWRPIPAALLSQSVVLCSGTEDKSFQLTVTALTKVTVPYRRKAMPTNQRSIRKKTCSVKFSATARWKNVDLELRLLFARWDRCRAVAGIFAGRASGHHLNVF